MKLTNKPDAYVYYMFKIAPISENEHKKKINSYCGTVKSHQIQMNNENIPVYTLSNVELLNPHELYNNIVFDSTGKFCNV